MYPLEFNDPLLNAARTNNTRLIKELVAQGAPINGFGNVLKSEIEKLEGGYFNFENCLLISTLQIGCLYGYIDVVRTCIELGADVNLGSDLPPPVHCAVLCANIKILELLEQNGAVMLKTANYTFKTPTFFGPQYTYPQSNTKFHSSEDLLETIKQSDSDIDMYITEGTLKKDDKGSCLYHALANGHVKQINQLLAADTTVSEKHYYAAGLSNQRYHHSKYIYDLLPKQSLPNMNYFHASSLERNEAFETLLNDIKSGQVNDLTKRYENLASLIALDKNGSCLYFALCNNSKSVTLELLQAGASVKNKHYYAAGLVNNKALYDILKDSQMKREPNFRSTDPYQLLGISKYASKEQIKAAYVRMVREYHPDHIGKDNDYIRLINEAYEKLTRNKCNQPPYESRDEDMHTGNNASSSFSA